MPQALSNVLGFPRIGAQRELKVATEAYWAGERSLDDLAGTAKRACARRTGSCSATPGIDLIPSNDFSLYDQVLDTIAMVGAVPERYGWDGSSDVDQDTYFAMARGRQAGGVDVTAMEMTKWFDTNYHYIVPELTRGMKFRFSSRKPLDQYQEAKELGIETKPVLVGPLTFLLLGKCAGEEFDRLELLDVARRGLRRGARGARQARRRVGADRRARAGRGPHARRSWRRSSAPTAGSPRSTARPRSWSTPTSTTSARRTRCSPACRSRASSLDFVRGEHNRELVARARLARGQDAVRRRRVRPQRLDQRPRAQPRRCSRSCAGAPASDIVVSTSCSLQHSPDRQAQRAAPRRRGPELDVVRRAEARRGGGAHPRAERGPRRDLRGAGGEPQGARGPAQLPAHPQPGRCASGSRRSPTPTPAARARSPTRRDAQHERLGLPLFPTTTIGSFPQTTEIRTARMRAAQGRDRRRPVPST